MVVGERDAEADGDERRHQRQRRDEVRLVAQDQPVIGGVGEHRDEQAREEHDGDEAASRRRTAAASWLSSKAAESAPSRIVEEKPTQAWKRSGRTPSICFIMMVPSAPAEGRGGDEEEAGREHRSRRVPHHDQHAERTSARCRGRAASGCARRASRMERSVVIGTPSCPTMEAADGLAVFSPTKKSAKPPPPMRMPTTTMRQRGPRHRQEPGRDGERDRRRSAARRRTAAARACRATTTFAMTVLSAQIRQMSDEEGEIAEGHRRA